MATEADAAVAVSPMNAMVVQKATGAGRDRMRSASRSEGPSGTVLALTLTVEEHEANPDVATIRRS